MESVHSKASFFIQVNDINLHYIDYGGDGPILVLLHGLTANAHAFDGIVDGLKEHYRLICPDLRGNGLSDKPAFCYTVAEHADDILGLIAHLGAKDVYLGGHSYGGYLSFYIASNHPEVVSRLVILDAAKSMNPNIREMLSKSLARLEAVYPSFDDYLAEVKKAPYLNFWDADMRSYYRADVEDLPDGTVTPRGNLMAMTEKSIGLAMIDWSGTIDDIKQPTLLINGVDDYTMDQPLLPDNLAKETVASMQHAQYAAVDGNHQTMLYGDGAREIVKYIIKFLG